MTRDDGWLTSAAISERLKNKSEPATKEAFYRALKDGDIRAKARIVDIKTTPGLVKITREEWPIPRKLWELFDTFLDLQSDALRGRVRIDEGNLLGIIGAGEFQCRQILFSEVDVVEHLGGSAIKLVNPGPRKGRTPAQQWPIFAAALAVWVHRRNDEAEHIAAYGSEELWNEIEAILSLEWDETLARTTFQRGIQEFLVRIAQEARKNRLDSGRRK